MNKRMKLKHGIFHKACDDRCYYHRVIKDKGLVTCNYCYSIGCKHVEVADKMTSENMCDIRKKKNERNS